MKKFLLSIATIFAFTAANAIDLVPDMIEGDELKSISANGVWVAGAIGEGSVVIRNLETDKYWPYFGTGIWSYFIGHGTAVSNIGVVVGATQTDNACYWENGVWIDLPNPSPGFISNAVSITPDGSVICGGIGNAPLGVDANACYLYPVVWYRQEGSARYGEPVFLPHPDYDLTGRVPQYITAITISEDGKTVGGQLRDYTGFMHEPIIYKCDDNGEWSYTLPSREILNPKNIKFPEWPGELDDVFMPSQEQFMTEEQLAAFTLAFSQWAYGDMEDMPAYEDFMTPEQIEAYNEAYREYIEIALPWSQKFDAFMDAYITYATSGTSFLFNNARLSPDGKYYVSTGEIYDTSLLGNSRTRLRPVVIDTSTGDYRVMETNRSVYVKSVSSNYDVLGYVSASGVDTGTHKAYIFPEMEDGGMYLENYIKEKNPDLYQWMEDYLYFDVITGLGTTTLYDTQRMMCTGIPAATPDMSVILTYNTTWSWYNYDGIDSLVSLILPMNWTAESGVESVALDGEYSIGFVNGAVCLTGEFSRVDIYDVAGNHLFERENTTGTLDSGLASGIYIVKGVTDKGDVLTKKVVF